MEQIKKIKSKITEKITSIFKLCQSKIGNVNYSGSTTKRAIGANYTMEFSTETKKKKEEIEAQVKEIVLRYLKAPEELINHLKEYNIEIHRIPYAEKVLSKFHEEEGFIVPLSGKKAFFLNNILRMLKEKSFQMKFKTEPMFIFDAKDVEVYTVARALYKYYGYKNNLAGYDSRAQELYKITSHRKENIFKGLSAQDILACKEAMSRDMESINFTITLSVEFANSKKAAAKITEDGANI
ncbi:hypothetical protein IJD44_09095 [bacterium]|nr:hypothetical protein [bacterium]